MAQAIEICFLAQLRLRTRLASPARDCACSKLNFLPGPWPGESLERKPHSPPWIKPLIDEIRKAGFRIGVGITPYLTEGLAKGVITARYFYKLSIVIEPMQIPTILYFFTVPLQIYRPRHAHSSWMNIALSAVTRDIRIVLILINMRTSRYWHSCHDHEPRLWLRGWYASQNGCGSSCRLTRRSSLFSQPKTPTSYLKNSFDGIYESNVVAKGARKEDGRLLALWVNGMNDGDLLEWAHTWRVGKAIVKRGSYWFLSRPTVIMISCSLGIFQWNNPKFSFKIN